MRKTEGIGKLQVLVLKCIVKTKNGKLQTDACVFSRDAVDENVIRLCVVKIVFHWHPVEVLVLELQLVYSEKQSADTSHDLRL